ncbi:hypothetical protein BCL76_11449 [Streptomyces sp. CG 926]|nr:hypothetical protein BCL76_11449 [Streptomyces sp. CG 926]
MMTTAGTHPVGHELIIRAAAAQGAYELDTLVGAGDRDRGIVLPCGELRPGRPPATPADAGVAFGQDRCETVVGGSVGLGPARSGATDFVGSAPVRSDRFP